MPKKSKQVVDNQSMGASKPVDEGNGHDMEDARCSRVAYDPMFREMPKKRRKVVVDERFKKMVGGAV